MASPTTAPPHAKPVNSKTAEHRGLHFDTIDQALAEAERLVAAEKAGTLRATGNWTLGQILGHISTWIEFAFDGYPASVNPPWLVRVLVSTRKKHYLKKGMPRGIRIPKFPDGTLGTERISTEAGHARFKAAMARLAASAPPRPNPIFGTLSHDEWIRLNLCHAALHLSYLWPK